MNRAPSSRDRWWNEHQLSCGGSYTKVREPEGYGKKKQQKPESTTEKSGGKPDTMNGRPSGCKDIKELMKINDKGSTSKGGSSTQGVGKAQVPHSSKGLSQKVFSGQGHTLLASGDRASNKQPASQSERRQKLLEAVEKRTQVAQTKGVKRKSTESNSHSHDIRTFSTQHRGKLPKLDPSTPSQGHTTASLTQETTDSDTLCEATCSSNTSKFLSGNDRCDVVDLVNDGRCISESDQVVVIDDGPELEGGAMPVEFQRMCPVCGRTDIPSDLINLHVAYCLED